MWYVLVRNGKASLQGRYVSKASLQARYVSLHSEEFVVALLHTGFKHTLVGLLQTCLVRLFQSRSSGFTNSNPCTPGRVMFWISAALTSEVCSSTWNATSSILRPCLLSSASRRLEKVTIGRAIATRGVSGRGSLRKSRLAEPSLRVEYLSRRRSNVDLRRGGPGLEFGRWCSKFQMV